MHTRDAVWRSLALTVIAGLLVALGGGVYGPGGSSASAAAPVEKAILTLNFLAGGPQAGFMYGKALGYYTAVGIDLAIQEGQGSVTTAQLVAAGKTDFGFSDAPSVMAVHAKGGPIKIVAPILQTNGFAIVSLAKEHITKVTDLVGKTMAVQPGTAQTALLDAIFSANHMQTGAVKVVDVDPSALVGTLLQGRADAILAGADFQSIQIRDRGAQINELFYRDIGVPTIGLSIAINDALIRRNPQLVARFVAASLKGWDAARHNPAAAAQAVVDQFPAAGNKEQFLKQLNVDIKLLCGPGATHLGVVPPSLWVKTFDLLTTYQHLPTTPPVTDYYTTQFVPTNPPACSR
jgi:NitT/TauT family transport system substrate-binding protein